MLRDFSPDNIFQWTALEEGAYTVKVRVKDSFDAADAASAEAVYRMTSRVTSERAVVTPTRNPLVALYSAPPCSAGTVFVAFRRANAGDNPWTTTSPLPCEPGASRNFLVAGMFAATTYEMVHVADGATSPPLFFTTGTPPSTLNIPRFTVRRQPTADSDTSQDVILHVLTGRLATGLVNLLATDLVGRLEWYYDPVQGGFLSTAPPVTLLHDGTILLAGRDRYRPAGLNVIREVDLAGNPIRETNLDAINAQLRSAGQDIIYGFHHEVLRLPTGETATLGWTHRTVVINGAPVDYAGDLLLVLDRNLTVVWTWNAFDHLDVNRGPVLGELCTGAPCPLVGDVDWLHENAIAWSPFDGNLLISIRHQDWLIKIAYERGAGDGHIVWRLGAGGDFILDAAGANPWFSHQHNPHYLSRSEFLLF